MMLAPASKALLKLLWVLASENNGVVDYDMENLRFRFRWNDLQEKDIQILENTKFIKIVLADASKCLQDASPETETETETDKIKLHSDKSLVGPVSQKEDPLRNYLDLVAFYPELINLIRAAHPKADTLPKTVGQITEWRKTLAALVRLDKFTEADVIAVLRWLFTKCEANGDFWWRDQVRSVPPLRHRKGGRSHNPRKFAQIYEAWQKAGGIKTKPKPTPKLEPPKPEPSDEAIKEADYRRDEIMEDICARLDLNSYTTWIDPMRITAIAKNICVWIEAESEYTRNNLQQTYGDLICDVIGVNEIIWSWPGEGDGDGDT